MSSSATAMFETISDQEIEWACKVMRLPLELSSRPGHGTRFRLALPATEARAPGAPDRADPALASGAWIGLLDDDEAVLAAMRQLAEHRGCRVVEGLPQHRGRQRSDRSHAHRHAGRAQGVEGLDRQARELRQPLRPDVLHHPRQRQPGLARDELGIIVG